MLQSWVCMDKLRKIRSIFIYHAPCSRRAVSMQLATMFIFCMHVKCITISKRKHPFHRCVHIHPSVQHSCWWDIATIMGMHGQIEVKSVNFSLTVPPCSRRAVSMQLATMFIFCTHVKCITISKRKHPFHRCVHLH